MLHTKKKVHTQNIVFYGGRERPWVFILFYALLSRDNDLLSQYNKGCFLMIRN